MREYLLLRDYPGNVRDLRRVVASLHLRHAGPGPITIGDVPEEERPPREAADDDWRDGGFEGAIGHAIELGIGLKEIGTCGVGHGDQAGARARAGQPASCGIPPRRHRPRPAAAPRQTAR